jgi:hypothetical protein
MSRIYQAPVGRFKPRRAASLTPNAARERLLRPIISPVRFPAGAGVADRLRSRPMKHALRRAFLAPVVICIAFAATLSVAEAQQAIPAPPDVAAPPSDAEVTASGLASKVLQPGTGTRHPKATDTVEVNYTGWTTDGKMFDTSIGGDPIQFPLSHVIAGWTEGVQLMVEGEKRRFWIPEDLAYQGAPGYPAGMLVFDVELLRIVTPQ